MQLDQVKEAEFMVENALTIKAFGDIIQHKMSKEAKKKFYDPEEGCFDSKAGGTFNASTQEKAYGLLFESLTYKLSDEEAENIPDFSKSCWDYTEK